MEKALFPCAGIKKRFHGKGLNPLQKFGKRQEKEEESADDGKIKFRFGCQKPPQPAAAINSQDADHKGEDGGDGKGEFQRGGSDACGGAVGGEGETERKGFRGRKDFHIPAVGFLDRFFEGTVKNFQHGQYGQNKK